jgi:hypothetical protein
MSLFPTDDKARKMLPIFRMVTGYFPKAFREITKVCVANNVRYNPDRDPVDINWARGKSTDQLGSAFRHMLERQVDNHVFEPVSPEVTKATGITSVYVLAEAAWRLCAALELEIERCETNQCEVQSAGLDSELQYHGNQDQSRPQREIHQGNDRLQVGRIDQRGCHPWTPLEVGDDS